MDARGIDPFRRYMDFSEKCCRINEVVAMANELIHAAYDERQREYVYLLNDLFLFLIQVMAFDGFVTECSHWLRWTNQEKAEPLRCRVERLAGPQMHQDRAFQVLLSKIAEISLVRDTWLHALGDPSIRKHAQWPHHMPEQFGLYEMDGHLWVRLSGEPARGEKPWSFLVSTLHEVARRVWAVVEAEVMQAIQGDGDGSA